MQNITYTDTITLSKQVTDWVQSNRRGNGTQKATIIENTLRARELLLLDHDKITDEEKAEFLNLLEYYGGSEFTVRESDICANVAKLGGKDINLVQLAAAKGHDWALVPMLKEHRTLHRAVCHEATNWEPHILDIARANSHWSVMDLWIAHNFPLEENLGQGFWQEIGERGRLDILDCWLKQHMSGNNFTPIISQSHDVMKAVANWPEPQRTKGLNRLFQHENFYDELWSDLIKLSLLLLQRPELIAPLLNAASEGLCQDMIYVIMHGPDHIERRSLSSASEEEKKGYKAALRTMIREALAHGMDPDEIIHIYKEHSEDTIEDRGTLLHYAAVTKEWCDYFPMLMQEGFSLFVSTKNKRTVEEFAALTDENCNAEVDWHNCKESFSQLWEDFKRSNPYATGEEIDRPPSDHPYSLLQAFRAIGKLEEAFEPQYWNGNEEARYAALEALYPYQKKYFDRERVSCALMQPSAPEKPLKDWVATVKAPSPSTHAGFAAAIGGM